MPAPPTSALDFGELVRWLGDDYHCWVGFSWPIFSTSHQHPPSYYPWGPLEIQEEKTQRPGFRVGVAKHQV